MQVYAWGTMLVDYSREDGILQGAKNTFSGEKPCALCCKIKSADPSDSKPPALPLIASKQLQEMVPTGEIPILSPTATRVPNVAFLDATLSAGISPCAPPVPPPCRTV